MIVVLAGDIMRYSVVGIFGIVLVFKKYTTKFIGIYFWVKFLQSYLNIFSSLLMVTLL